MWANRKNVVIFSRCWHRRMASRRHVFYGIRKDRLTLSIRWIISISFCRFTEMHKALAVERKAMDRFSFCLLRRRSFIFFVAPMLPVARSILPECVSLFIYSIHTAITQRHRTNFIGRWRCHGFFLSSPCFHFLTSGTQYFIKGNYLFFGISTRQARKKQRF